MVHPMSLVGTADNSKAELSRTFFISLSSNPTEPQRSVARTNAVYREGAMKISTTLAFASFCLAFAPIVAAAGAPENQQSCMYDAMTVCAQFIPDRDRVANCLISNRSRISEACRMALAHYNRPMTKLITVP